MLRHISTIHGFTIHATDGEIGSVADLLFDDQTWTVRYLAVGPDGWLSNREVLISPISVYGIAWDQHRVDVKLTREQVEKSPDISTDPPVSRQHEAAYYAYYGYPTYWTGTGLWGAGMFPDYLATSALAGPTVGATPDVVPPNAPSADADETQESTNDPHLRSTREVIGYAIHASDGHIGHVEDFLYDPRSWALRYLVVDTRNWWPGKKVLIAPTWIEQVMWPEREVVVPHTRDAIKGAPEFTDVAAVDEDFMQRLAAYYRQA